VVSHPPSPGDIAAPIRRVTNLRPDRRIIEPTKDACGGVMTAEGITAVVVSAALRARPSPSTIHDMNEPDRLSRLLALLESDPDDAFCLYGIAQEHAGRGDHETAIEWYERAAAADPGDGYIHYHRARSLEAIGRREEAVEAVRAGLEAADRGGDAHARAELSALLDELGD
jgi:tetratricopeptide (TPR) repeat protein